MNEKNTNMYNRNIDASRNIDNMQNIAGLNQNPYINQQVNNPINSQQTNNMFLNGDFIKGALVGAAITFLLTNKDAQNTIMKTVSKGSELFQAGMEELKERYEDARAQMEANQE